VQDTNKRHHLKAIDHPFCVACGAAEVRLVIRGGKKTSHTLKNQNKPSRAKKCNKMAPRNEPGKKTQITPTNRGAFLPRGKNECRAQNKKRDQKNKKTTDGGGGSAKQNKEGTRPAPLKNAPNGHLGRGPPTDPRARAGAFSLRKGGSQQKAKTPGGRAPRLKCFCAVRHSKQTKPQGGLSPFAGPLPKKNGPQKKNLRPRLLRFFCSKQNPARGHFSSTLSIDGVPQLRLGGLNFILKRIFPKRESSFRSVQLARCTGPKSGQKKNSAGRLVKASFARISRA